MNEVYQRIFSNETRSFAGRGKYHTFAYGVLISNIKINAKEVNERGSLLTSTAPTETLYATVPFSILYKLHKNSVLKVSKLKLRWKVM